MFKRVLFIASLLFCISYSVQAATLKAYIKYFSTANACTYTIYNFQDSSKYTGTNKGTLRYKWYYSDGTTDTGTSVTKYFKTTGTFTISLVVSNATDGLKDSTEKSVTISGTGILPSYTMTGPLCERSEPLFTLTSSKSASYFTSFGDGGTVSGTTLGSHTYSTRGTYKFQIKDSTAAGCKSSVTNYLVIAARPYARRPTYVKAHCQDSFWTFNAYQQAASDTQGMRVTYVWKFPDKTVYNGKTVSNKYFADSGDITAEIYAINHVGSCSDSFSFTFRVFSNPIVNFHLIPVCQDSLAIINDSSQSVFSSGLYSWHWRICDSNHTNCDTTGGYSGYYAPAGITYGFPHGGSFYVTEYVKTIEGCADSATKLVYINPTPTPDFNFKNTCVDSAVQFTDASTVPKGNSIKGWKWNFGDTTYLYTQNPAHQYKRAGYKYQVKLTSKTQAGCIDSITKTVVAYPLPQTDYAFISECVSEQKVPFASNSSMPNYALNDNIAHYLWIYGDGKTDTGSTALHTFTTPGNHYVKLVAYSAYGCTDTSTKKVFVYPLPRPNFKLVGDCERDSVIFQNLSKASFGAIKDSSYTWNFGDTLVANFVTNPKHLYAYSGSFPVTLKVTDSLQCYADTVINVSIIPGPHSSFTVGPACTGEPITFTNTTFTKSSGTIKYIWNFGDGTPNDTNKNPVHTYNISKNYRVRLTSYIGNTQAHCEIFNGQ